MDEEKETRRINSVRDLEVYKLAFESAMEIFEVSKSFPKEEIYSLTDQIRRSSRSVCVNLAEGWRKRRYKAVFVNKLTDAEQEAAETQTWLEFALKCKYMNNETLHFESPQARYLLEVFINGKYSKIGSIPNFL